MEKISSRSRWRWLVGKQYRITVLDSRWLMQFPRRMINRGRGGGVVLVLSNERKWPARHSGHAWIELKRLRMSRIGSWLVFQFPRRAVSRGLQPVSFSLNRPPCCDFILEFNHVLSFFLPFFLDERRRILERRRLESRWISDRELERSKPSTETWKHLVELFMRQAECARKIETGGFDLRWSRVLLFFLSRIILVDWNSSWFIILFFVQ